MREEAWVWIRGRTIESVERSSLCALSRSHSPRSCWSHARPGSPGRHLVGEAQKQRGWVRWGADGTKQHAGGVHALSGIPAIGLSLHRFFL